MYGTTRKKRRGTIGSRRERNQPERLILVRFQLTNHKVGRPHGYREMHEKMTSIKRCICMQRQILFDSFCVGYF